MNDGGSAFPYEEIDRSIKDAPSRRFGHSGMSLRDYFAAQALATAVNQAAHAAVEQGKAVDSKSVAVMAYDIADAMLEARK